MFTKTFSAAILIICLFIACGKSSIKLNHLTNTKWVLTETLFDPGNGSGQWMPVSPSTPNQIIEFKQGGKFSGGQVAILHNYDHWKASSDSTLTFTTSAYSINNTIYSNYKMENGKLIISLACIEACALKFENAK